MFTSIVVALDLEWQGDRALPIAQALSELGDVSVELLTVSSPSMSEEVDAFALRQRATANGWSADSYVIVHDDDPARAIVHHIDSRPGALLVMATTAKSPLRSHFLGSVSEAVLNRIDRPVLLIGPHVPATNPMASTTLIACVDSTNVATAAFTAISSWVESFVERDAVGRGGPPGAAAQRRWRCPDRRVIARPQPRDAARRRRRRDGMGGAARRRHRRTPRRVRQRQRRRCARHHQHQLD